MTAVAVRGMTEVEARASVDRARTHLQAAADEVLAQVEGRAWEALGYPDWDTMRAAEYRGPAVIVPTAERPGLVGRLRDAGLPPVQIGPTVGVSRQTVWRDLGVTKVTPPPPPPPPDYVPGIAPAYTERSAKARNATAHAALSALVDKVAAVAAEVAYLPEAPSALMDGSLTRDEVLYLAHRLRTSRPALTHLTTYLDRLAQEMESAPCTD